MYSPSLLAAGVHAGTLATWQNVYRIMTASVKAHSAACKRLISSVQASTGVTAGAIHASGLGERRASARILALARGGGGDESARQEGLAVAVQAAVAVLEDVVRGVAEALAEVTVLLGYPPAGDV